MPRVPTIPDDVDDGSGDARHSSPASRRVHGLTDEAWEIRNLWIRFFRDHVSSRTGRPSGYVPSAHWDGQADRAGRSRKAIWPRIVQFIREHNLMPALFLQAQFHNLHGDPPQPNMILNQRALDRYHLFLRRLPGDRSLELRVQTQRMSWLSYRVSVPGRSEEDVVRGILLNPRVELSPLFRYCHAVAAGLDDVTAVYLPQAMVQYQIDPDGYDAAWGECIPQRLKDLVGRSPAVAGRICS